MVGLPSSRRVLMILYSIAVTNWLKNCAQVVQNQQVTFQHQREVALRLVLCVVEAEFFLFQLCQQVLRRTVDDPVALVDDLSCNGKRKMGLAKTGIATALAGWARTALC